MTAVGAGRGRGARIVAASGLLGAIVSIVNYFSESSGIQDTGGALLVIASSLLVAILGWRLARASGTGGINALSAGLCLVLLLGTAFAAWLLNSPTLLALMAIGCIGWLMRARRPRTAVA